MQEHLDMHIRQNRKASQNTGCGHSRSWFIGVDVRVHFLYDTLTATHNAFQDWIHDISVDVKGKGCTDGNWPLNVKAAAAAAVIAKCDAELRALYVVVLSGDEAKPACPICKEAIKSEFLAEDLIGNQIHQIIDIALSMHRMIQMHNAEE